MLLTTLMFVTLDALAKQLSQSYPVLQVVWARYVFHALLIVVWLRRRLPGSLRSERPVLQLLRSLLILVTTGVFFSALRFMPLADASAVMFVAPLIVTALSLPLLGEYVGPRRWASVVVGFAGALIVIRPGGGALGPVALLPLAAACGYALYQITTRILSRSDQALTTLAYTALVGTLATSAAVPFVWVTPAPADWLAMVALGVFGGLGHFALIKALSSAPAAMVTPFGYTSLLWATAFGYVMFGDLPDRWTVIGALIIAGSGLYIFHREQLRKSAAPPDGSS